MSKRLQKASISSRVGNSLRRKSPTVVRFHFGSRMAISDNSSASLLSETPAAWRLASVSHHGGRSTGVPLVFFGEGFAGMSGTYPLALWRSMPISLTLDWA